jgi:hypothetical protein
LKLRPCAQPKCGAIVRAPARYCAPHALEQADRLADDRDRREPWRYLYGLKIWREAREAVRRQAGYACERCGRGEELAARALDVHHVRPLSSSGGSPAAERRRSINQRSNTPLPTRSRSACSAIGVTRSRSSSGER